jgi:hypothetical protein
MIVALGLICAMGIAIRLWLIRAACETEEKLKIEVSGYQFEVDDVSCDTIAKDEHIKVYGRKMPSPGARFFPEWRNPRMLLFEYDPGRSDNPPPLITHPSQSTILISIGELSEIIYQSHRWNDMYITYDIRKIDYPAPVK